MKKTKKTLIFNLGEDLFTKRITRGSKEEIKAHSQITPYRVIMFEEIKTLIFSNEDSPLYRQILTDDVRFIYKGDDTYELSTDTTKKVGCIYDLKELIESLSDWWYKNPSPIGFILYNEESGKFETIEDEKFLQENFLVNGESKILCDYLKRYKVTKSLLVFALGKKGIIKHPKGFM